MTSQKSTSTIDTNKLALGIILCIYILFGLYTFWIFVNTQPDYDFQFYERALSRAVSGLDPYDIRDIGSAFLYPPASLFVIEAFGLFANPTLRYYAVLFVNIAVMLFMICWIAIHFGYSAKEIWFWFPSAFFSAPFLATLQLGQINLITEFGIILFFVAASPWLAAVGLTLASITKVTPVAFLFYSLIRRDSKTIVYTLIILVAIVLTGGFRYGFSTYTTYWDVFTDLLQTTALTQNSQSFESKVWMVF